MKNFNWEEFKNGEIAVHCDTEEKADDFLKECEKRNIKWIGGDNATHHNHYSVNFGLTCYCGKKGVLTYSDKVYFIQEGTTIVKWEVKEVKERTFKEVIANIKEGEVWENNKMNLVIKLIEGRIYIGDRYDNEVDGFIGQYIPLTLKFELQRKKYSFEEAFKAYEEGKEIESKEFKYKKINGIDGFKLIREKYGWNECEDGFEIHLDEIRDKWYIND